MYLYILTKSKETIEDWLKINCQWGGQEPIIRNFHLPYLPSESTVSLSTSHGVFRGSLHNSQSQESSSLYCLRHIKVTYFNNGEKLGKFTIFFRVLCEPPLTYYSSKNKKIRDRVDSRVQLVWRLRVMGSWRDHWNIKEPYEGINRFYLDTIKSSDLPSSPPP